MKSSNYRIGYVSCKGHCGKEVPAWITPLTCRYCAKTRKCVQCGGPNKESKSNGMCSKCYDIEYPTRVCSCGKTFVTLKCVTVLQCNVCAEKYYQRLFIDSFLPTHPDYVVKIKITGTKLTHSGYCSDPRSKSSKNVCYKRFFPAPVSFVDSEDYMNSRIKSLISYYDLKSYDCCHWGVTEYNAATWKLVHKTPHMRLSDWSQLNN